MMRPQRRIAPTATELHRRWLDLVDTDGPFLAVPPLKRVWPQGMPTLDGNARALLAESKLAFEKAWDQWDRQRNDAALTKQYTEARNVWVDTVLRDVAGWGELLIADANLPALSSIRAWSPNRSVSVGISGAIMREDMIGALLLVVDPVDSLRDIVDDGWAASPIDRMEALLRASDTAIGVVTDGRWWALVCARDEAMAASGFVDSQTWIDQKDTRDAFFALLQLGHLVGGKAEDRLQVLFKESIAAAEEITEALGVQVRRAVELLVSALSEAAVEARQNGQPDPLPASRGVVYDAAVTMMMRIVFLLFAEERNLLPQGQLFTMGYGITGELDALGQRDREETSEALDATHLTWYRLLSTSQALYAGATFEDMRLPSYGGSLFDPARFPFLLDRQPRGTLAVTVSDRVMLEVLSAVQIAQLKGQPARRISFRDIDVEQIGYIYEGLLGYSCADVDEIAVGLTGSSGSEPELSLSDLEELAAQASTESKLADAIIAYVKATQPGAKPTTKAAITKALASPGDAASIELALLSVTTDAGLRGRLRPFAGIIRRDLRDRPMVIQPGGLVVVETPSRASAGAHYTPKSLAEEVVEHALEPLVFQPGPHQTNDQTKWIPLSSDRILDLKVADIACGSGAFLVAAARYLARRLVEAWHKERVGVGDSHDLYVHALRQVLANCIYGADINAMAVEMCKLSLWLVSLDPKQSFSFVDDKVLHGNSLLGLTDVRQLKAMNIDPNSQRNQTSLYDIGIDSVLAQAVSLRRHLATEVDDRDPQRSATSKRRQWADYQMLIAPLAYAADGVIAAGLALGGKPGKALIGAYEKLQFAVGLAYPANGKGNALMLDRIINTGLTPTVPTDYERWQPLHWILAVPDVMESGGFDAIVGNPPFWGGNKLTGTMGTNTRDWLVNQLADGQRGSADLVAYFFLRAMSLLNARGLLGLIATNTVAQGDSREVGLDRMVEAGLTITRSVQSRAWPAAGAKLEYAAVWGTLGPVENDAERISDGFSVQFISTLLEPSGRVTGLPMRLTENAGVAYIGCYVLGLGFVLEPTEASDWIEQDRRNADVLFPYLSGEDLNSRADASASRWVIDFYARSEESAATYALPFARVENKVKSKRQSLNRKALRDRWWQYAEKRPAMRGAISGLDEILVVARVSKAVMPMRINVGAVPSEQLVVFATDSHSFQAVLSSSLHQLWAITYSSTLETRVRYTPSDVFETFPRPASKDSMDQIGRTLNGDRREIMLRRDLGLTKLYNLMNDPDTTSDVDADRMREMHATLDQVVMAAYGWGDVPLEHGFHTYRQAQRWTVSPAARVEILDRLLEENHRRAASQGAAAADVADEDLEVDA